MVEIDPLVVEVSRKYLPQTAGALDDPRVSIHYEDGLRYVRTRENEYDLIIVDSTDPFGPGEGLFTKEFYGNCYKALTEDGIMVNQCESPFYEEDARASQRGAQADRGELPDQQGLSGAYPDVSLRPLAVRFCVEEVPSAARF